MASQFPDNRPAFQPAPGTPPSAGGIARLQRLFTAPRAEWPAIAATPGDAAGVFVKLAVPLAAIGPVARLLHDQLFGTGAFGITFKPGLTWSIFHAVEQYLVALAGVWIVALVTEALAPTFGAIKSRDQAMKLTCYSATAAWLAQGFAIVPYVGYLLPILGLYSIVLFALGLPILLRPQPDKAVGYTVVALIAGGVAAAVFGAIVGAIFGLLTPPMTVGETSTLTLGSTATGDSATVNLGQLAAAGQQFAADAQRQAQAAQAGTAANGHIADAATLQAMLPASVAGFARTAVESSGGTANGVGAATAKGTYTAGDQSFELSVSDVGALGGLATLGGALNVNSNKQTANGYERMTMQNGSMVAEEWDGAAHHGKYSTMVASRFAIAAEGTVPSVDPLKAAVAAIDTGKLAGLAK